MTDEGKGTAMFVTSLPSALNTSSDSIFTTSKVALANTLHVWMETLRLREIRYAREAERRQGQDSNPRPPDSRACCVGLSPREPKPSRAVLRKTNSGGRGGQGGEWRKSSANDKEGWQVCRWARLRTTQSLCDSHIFQEENDLPSRKGQIKNKKRQKPCTTESRA